MTGKERYEQGFEIIPAQAITFWYRNYKGDEGYRRVARHLRMAHGLVPRLARIRVPDHKHGGTVNAAKACISAQGDAILPQIAEIIERAIMNASQQKPRD